MVPSAIVSLPALPRTANGKLDRNALPAPNFLTKEPTETSAGPMTPLEANLATIWGEILGASRVAASDSFFDLGGHSLAGLRVVSRLSEVIGQPLSPSIFLEAPTVAAMADLLQTKYPAAVARWTNKSSRDEVKPASSKERPLAPVTPVNRESRRTARSRK